MGKYHEDAGFPVNSFGFCTYPGIKPDGKIILKLMPIPVSIPDFRKMPDSNKQNYYDEGERKNVGFLWFYLLTWRIIFEF